MPNDRRILCRQTTAPKQQESGPAAGIEKSQVYCGRVVVILMSACLQDAIRKRSLSSEQLSWSITA
jgi:hypothetical protein